MQESTIAANSSTVVTSSDGRAPIRRPNRPAMAQPSSGRKTIAWYISTLHQVHVFDRDRAAVAEIDHQDGQPDRRFRRRHGEHDEREHLADDVAEAGREPHQVDVDREQDQLDRHQDYNHVLAVEENAENPEREQDRGDREVMAEADDHHQIPSPGRTWRISIAVLTVRAFCSAIFWRRTLGLWRKVSTIAPLMATSSTRPAAWK